MRNFQCLSAPTTLFFSALSSLLLCFAPVVSASDYSWTISAYTPQYGTPTTSSSPTTACTQHISKIFPSNAFDKIVPITTTSIACYMTSSGSSSQLGTLTRAGDGCTSPAVYNSATYSCEAPEPDKCEPTIGKRIGHWHNFGTLGAAANEAPITVCEGSCQYSNTFETPECSRNFPDKAFCSLTYLGNGVECTEGDASNPSNFDQPPTKPPVDQKPERSHEQSCDTWVTGEDGIARRKCTSRDEYKDPGQLDCENTNGYLKCAPGPKPPAYTETKTETNTEKKDNPDGSSKTETTTKKDVTNCHGTKPCKTDSTETKETDNKNPDGSPGDKTTTCKGDKCTADEDPEPGTDPDAEEEGEEEKSSVSGGSTCDAPPVCEGDAIQCAILRQEFTQRCADEKFREVTPENTNALKTDLEVAFSGDQYKPITADAENTYSLEGMIDTSSRFSSSCPTIQSVSYKWVDGSSQSFDPNFPGLCEYLRWMGFLLVAFAMRAAAEIIAGGLK